MEPAGERGIGERLSQGASPSETGKAEVTQTLLMKPLSKLERGTTRDPESQVLAPANPSISWAWLEDALSPAATRNMDGGEHIGLIYCCSSQGLSWVPGAPSHPRCTHGIKLSLGSARMAPRSRRALAASSPSCPVSLCLARYQPLPWGREGLRAREGRGGSLWKEETGSGS